MNHKVTLIGAEALRKELASMRRRYVKEVKKETYAAGLDVQRKAKENLKDAGSWDQGNLANTILVDPIKGGVAVEVGPTAPYGPYVEFGARPHFPPPDALEGWAKRHGFDSAWPICLAIARRGLPAKPYLLPAYFAVVDNYFNKLKGILKK